jgi:hypothetical protein
LPILFKIFFNRKGKLLEESPGSCFSLYGKIFLPKGSKVYCILSYGSFFEPSDLLKEYRDNMSKIKGPDEPR